MPTEMLERKALSDTEPTVIAAEPGSELRDWARKHIERVHKLKRHIAIYLLGIATLTGVWALVEWQDNGALRHLSDNGNPGDWDPWILYVALIWGFFVVLDALKVYFDRPTTETEIDRAVDRIRSHR